jgi:superfamily I DNA and/or RNA helicase
MLSGNISSFLHAVPIKTLVVDEASQINIGDYIPILNQHKSILKLVFIGDDKQRKSAIDILLY